MKEPEVFKGRDINLQGSWLNGADLRAARLAKVILTKAHLQGATLRKAHLSGADLMEAYLQGADLRGVHLQGSNLSRAYLQGAGNVKWSPYMSFRNRIQRQLRKKADLSSVIFAGGLKKKDMDELVEGLSNRKANELREKLEPHIGEPISHELPKDSGAITGVYKKKKAKKWIAEYKEAMSEKPEDDS